MSTDFLTALRQAAQATRDLDFTEAARILRDALGGAMPAAVPDLAPTGPDAPTRSLRAVVEELRQQRPAMPRTPAPAPDAGLEARTFTCAAGSRDYRLFVPDGPPEGLLVMLHGCAQGPEDFATGTRMNALAARHGIVVAWPAQREIDNPRGCWNWFEPAHQQRGEGEPAILAGLAEALAKEFAIPASRVFVAGLSAGGSMAAVLGETYPEVFAAVGVHSGLACGAANDIRSALAAMRGAPAAPRPLAPSADAPRVIVFQGTADPVVHPMNADRLMARASALAGARPARATHTAAGDRGVSRTVARRRDGTPAVELWMVEGSGHVWSGGDASGSFAEAAGPDASAEMLRFFLADS